MNILEEALQVIQDRQAKYGSPRAHWSLTTRLINAYFGTDFRAEDWAVCMIFDKLARERNSHLRDNSVDVAGYTAGRETVLEEQ